MARARVYCLVREPLSSRHGNWIGVTAAECGVTTLGEDFWERDESQITGNLECYAQELELIRQEPSGRWWLLSRVVICAV